MEKAKYRLDLGDERLWHGDQLVQISNKAFQLLRLLVGNPNRLLTKDHILDAVWGDVCVSEGLIKEYVHDLRQALGDDPKQPQFIETVHGRGYRFLGGVEVIDRALDDATPSEPRTEPPSLAVMAFTDLVGEARWSLFCRGLSDDLVTDLARYPDLVVVTNGEVSALLAGNLDVRNLNRELGVDYVLNGSVQASKSRVRVNAQLIETLNGTHIWTDQYEREVGEFFEIQSDIVGHVASAVGGFSGQIPHTERQRLGRKPPGNLESYELYLLGCELETHFEKESTLRGFEMLQRAVELDPDFARAWLALAWTCWQTGLEKWADDLQSYWELERKAFLKAASLDPLDPFALMELASVRAKDGDIIGASDALERALDLRRNQADLLIAASNYAATLMDDPARAVQLMDKGLKMIIRIPAWHYLSAVRVSYFAKEFDRALSNALRGPDNLATKLFELLATAQLGRREEVQVLGRAFEARYPEFDPEAFMEVLPITADGARRLFLEGVEKARLKQSWTPHLVTKEIS